AGFAYLEVREERARLVEDLKRRAALVGSTVSQAAESLVARGGNKNGLERVLARFGRPDRPIAIYDAFGSVLAATSEVRPFLGPISPLITEAIEKNEQVAQFQSVAGRLTWVHVLPLQQDERPIGATAVLLDAQYLDAADWNL